MEPVSLPQPLHPFTGPLPEKLAWGAVAGLGSYGAPVRALVEQTLMPPDILTGLSLHLLAHQPRRSQAGRPRKGAIEGGVWVREQVTYHRPLEIARAVTISGESAARFTVRGRRYGVTLSQTRGPAGERIASNCTTGLLSYRKEPNLQDQRLGLSEKALAPPGPDWSFASRNPCLERLTRVREGECLRGEPIPLTLEMMRLRDAGREHNPIHTDPAVAKREGLKAPIAGGSHVLSFVQALLMAQWGPECLLYGTSFDVRWVGQTYAGTRIVPSVRVCETSADEVNCEVEVTSEDRPLLRGTLRLPLVDPRPA